MVKAANLARIQIGTRMAVYWPDESVFYEATVTKVRDHRACYYIYYDFGEREWIDLSCRRFEVIEECCVPTSLEEAPNAESDDDSEEDHATLTNDQPEAQDKYTNADEAEIVFGDPSQVTVGSRIALYWPEDNDFYEAMVIRMRDGPNSFYLEFGDGEREWLDLAKLKFYFVSDDDEIDEQEEEAEGDDQEGSLRSKICASTSESVVEANALNAATDKLLLLANAGEKAAEISFARKIVDDCPTTSSGQDAPSMIKNVDNSKSALSSSASGNSNKQSPKKGRKKKQSGSRSAMEKRDDARKKYVTRLESSNVRDAGPDSDNVEEVVVGSKIGVWWPEDETFYNAEVVAVNKRKTSFHLQYEDEHDEWLDLRSNKFLFIPGSKRLNSGNDASESSCTKQQRLAISHSNVDLGCRISVWWDDDKAYYQGVVTQIREGSSYVYVVYDDGEQEWLNLAQHKYSFGEQDHSNATGKKNRSRIAERGSGCVDSKDTDDESDISLQILQPSPNEVREAQNFRKSIAKSNFVSQSDEESIEPLRSRRQKKRRKFSEFTYQESDNESENDLIAPPRRRRSREVFEKPVDLSLSIIGGRKSTRSEMKKDNRSKTKRPGRPKSKPTKAMKEAQVKNNKNQAKAGKTSAKSVKGGRINRVVIGSRVSIWWEGEKRYYEGVVAKMRSAKRGYFVKYDDGDKEWVDLHMEKFMLLDYENESDAAHESEDEDFHESDGEDEHLEESVNKPAGRGTRRPSSMDENNAVEPLSKRMKSSTHLKSGRKNNEMFALWTDDDNDFKKTPKRKKLSPQESYLGVSVEQIDILTGKVVKIWPSVNKVSTTLDISRSNLKRLLSRQGKPYMSGYFWRCCGETHGPWIPPEFHNLKIEQLSLTSGNVLNVFDSVSAAREAVGTGMKGLIYDVCIGVRDSAMGYFWRVSGSDDRPKKLRGAK